MMPAGDGGDVGAPRPIPDSLGYDEVGTRTRQAWLRTSLVIIVLSLLVARSLISAGHPPALVVLVVVPAAVLLAVAGYRTHRLRRHEREPLPGWMVSVTVGGSLALAVLVVVGIIVTPA